MTPSQRENTADHALYSLSIHQLDGSDVLSQSSFDNTCTSSDKSVSCA